MWRFVFGLIFLNRGLIIQVSIMFRENYESHIAVWYFQLSQYAFTLINSFNFLKKTWEVNRASINFILYKVGRGNSAYE